MLFTSPEFIILFLPITVSLWWWFQRKRRLLVAQWLITVASLIFYGGWSPNYLPLLIGAMCLNYGIGRYLVQFPSKLALTGGVSVNLVLLAFFKIAAAHTETAGLYVTDLSNHAGSSIPLGISFFTFQAITFLVGCQHRLNADLNFGRFVFSSAFFPHLIAGPILRYSDVMPQLVKGLKFDGRTFSQGLFLLAAGLCKKAAIADRLGGIIDPLFADTIHLQMGEAWTAVIGYSLQIYFDFSGYTDMALGTALLFGLTLPQNFNSPYQAVSITDFWRRWHISLSSFLRDYLYIPLGGNRKGAVRSLSAVLITMLLGGIWHGIGWTYLSWGLWHGLMIAGHRLWQTTGYRLNRQVSVLATYLGVTLGWVLFRADSLGQAVSIFRSLSGMKGFAVPPLMASACPACQVSGTVTGLEITVMSALLWFCLSQPSSGTLAHALKPGYRALGLLAILFFFGFWFPGEHGTFIYWQF